MPAGSSRTASALGLVGGLIVGLQPPDLVRLVGTEALTVGGLMITGFVAAAIDGAVAGFLAVLLTASLGLLGGFALSFPQGFGGEQPLVPLGVILIGVTFVVPGYVIGRLVAGLITRIRSPRPDRT